MPVYEFCCPECNIIFERLKKMSESDDPHPCPECQVPAGKIPSVANHKFSHPASQTRGMAPPSTGTSDDFNYDKVIGRDAEKKHKVIQDRQAHKRSIIRDNPGATGHDLSRTHDGTYAVMKPEQRRVVETARENHKKAMETISKAPTVSPVPPKGK